MSDKSQSTGLPVWSKLLMAVVVVSFAGIFALGILTLIGIKELAKECLDPVAVAAVAHKVASFPQPLPSGYHYLAGIGLPGLEIVTIEHLPEKQLLTVMSADANHDTGGKDLLEYGYSLGPNMLTTSAKFSAEKGRGTVVVATQQMPFILGDTVDISKRKGEGMVGCIQIPVKERKKNILIYALQTTDVPYNQEITLNLLNSITRF